MLFGAVTALDILAALLGVDPKRLGAIAHSLGAKEVLYLAALDERVRVAVRSEGGIGTSFSNWSDPWYLGDAIRRPDFHHETMNYWRWWLPARSSSSAATRPMETGVGRLSRRCCPSGGSMEDLHGLASSITGRGTAFPRRRNGDSTSGLRPTVDESHAGGMQASAAITVRGHADPPCELPGLPREGPSACGRR